MDEKVIAAKRLGRLLRERLIWTTATSLMYYDLKSKKLEDIRSLSDIPKLRNPVRPTVSPMCSLIHDCVGFHQALASLLNGHYGGRMTISALVAKDEHACLHLDFGSEDYICDGMFIHEVVQKIIPGTTTKCGPCMTVEYIFKDDGSI